ncbi:hypothetical protein Tco_0515058 [Tanacetum coccineum]
MASHSLKSRYAIKECSTCGSLYTKECCSIGSFEDKILTPVPSPRCARCGTTVDGPSCHGCAFLRKKFDEDLGLLLCENGIFKDFQDTSESSNDNTNVVNALREPFVVNQDPGEKSSQGPPQIDHNCCYKCGDSLDGIFCRQCICKSCGKGAHFGYNCPPKDPIISKPEPCNQTIKLPQTLPSLDPSCFSLPHVSKPNLVDDPPNVFNLYPQILPIVQPICNYENGNSFTYDSKPHSFNVSSSVFNQPQQPQFETYLCELCGNNAHYGYDCSPQFPFVYEPEPCYNQNFNDNYYPQNSPNFSQQYLCCAYIGGPHYDYQCQPINETYYEPNPSYDYSGFDQPQPPQDSVDCQEALDKILEELEELKRDQRMLKECEEIDEEYKRDCEIRIRKLKQDFNKWGSEVRKKEKAYEEEKYSAACRYMLSVTCDDEDDYIPLAITTDLPIEEPDNSLKMGDEHLDTIPARESDEVIKYSVENLVPISSEFEGISNDTCDVPNCDNNCVNVESELVGSLINHDTSIVHSSKIDPILEEFAGELAHIAPIPSGIVEADFDSNNDTSSDDDNLRRRVRLARISDVEQEEKEFDLEDILQIQDIILHEKLLNIHRLISKIESLKIEPDQEGLISIDNSNDPLLELPEFESFHFDPSLPRPLPEPPDVCLDMFYNDESFEPREGENIVVSNVEEDDSFTFTICTFLPFLTYPKDSPLSCSTGSEDLIFDPGIITFHFLKPLAFLWKFLSSIFALSKDE